LSLKQQEVIDIKKLYNQLNLEFEDRQKTFEDRETDLENQLATLTLLKKKSDNKFGSSKM